MDTKVVFIPKKDDQVLVRRRKARSVVCGNEETDYERDSVSLLAYRFVIKFILSFSIQKGWE